MACRHGVGLLAISVAGALLVAEPAAAHLSINPPSVRTGALTDLVFSVPNIGDSVGIDHVTLGIPQDFDLDDVEAKPGWTQSRTGQAVTWSGGMIPKGTFARFAIGVAIVAAVLALAALFVGLYLWLRPPPP